MTLRNLIDCLINLFFLDTSSTVEVASQWTKHRTVFKGTLSTDVT